MAMSYKTRRRLSLLILVVGLPAYILVATWLATWIAPQSMLGELAIYVVLGIIWIAPLKSVFKGIGQHDPDVPIKRFDDDPLP
ncbi:DUF2842 domain-containing protein [Celeribacter sp.]|uniref:DUF2842 domain-containing protein n=1 Tax=Celeribacter sp. TaxID=1890673 RepID=UPI003A8DEE7F